MILAEIITLLHSADFKGAGKYTELAKGQNEMVGTWADIKRKIIRQWLSRKK